jgi:hypothetical protein
MFHMRDTIIITFEYEGRQRNANVSAIEQGDFDNVFHVTLDDGYENNFFRIMDGYYQWYEQNIGYTELAKAIGRAIEITFLH